MIPPIVLPSRSTRPETGPVPAASSARRSPVRCSPILFLLLLLAASVSFAVPPELGGGSVQGRVITSDGEVVHDARVELLDIHRRTEVDDEGRFSFDHVPPGRHLLYVDSLRFGTTAVEFDLAEGQDLQLDVGERLTIHRDSIVVSAAATARDRFEVASATDVLSSEELSRRAEGTLGATLAGRAGVSETGFSAGASRPVIRGLSGRSDPDAGGRSRYR